jgi:hypothetical protein
MVGEQWVEMQGEAQLQREVEVIEEGGLEPPVEVGLGLEGVVMVMVLQLEVGLQLVEEYLVEAEGKQLVEVQWEVEGMA